MVLKIEDFGPLTIYYTAIVTICMHMLQDAYAYFAHLRPYICMQARQIISARLLDGQFATKLYGVFVLACNTFTRYAIIPFRTWA